MSGSMDEKKKKQLEAWNRTRANGTKKWLENRRKKRVKTDKRDLLSDCCGADFDAFGFERQDGLYQEKCLKCFKPCEPIYRLPPKKAKKKRTKRIKLPSIKSLVTKADSIFSLWIRNRDKKCVLCGKTEGLQNGHFIKRSKKSVRWDEVNCNTLCAGCNKLDNYEHDHYVVWFLREYGQPMYEDLLDRSKQTIDLTREYLINIIEKYK